MFLAIAVDNLADADSLTTIEKDEHEEDVAAEQLIEEPNDTNAMIERKKSVISRRSIKSIKKRRNTQLHLDIEAASGNLLSRFVNFKK